MSEITNQGVEQFESQPQNDEKEDSQIQMEVFTDSITMNGMTSQRVEDRNGDI